MHFLLALWLQHFCSESIPRECKEELWKAQGLAGLSSSGHSPFQTQLHFLACQHRPHLLPCAPTACRKAVLQERSCLGSHTLHRCHNLCVQVYSSTSDKHAAPQAVSGEWEELIPMTFSVSRSCLEFKVYPVRLPVQKGRAMCTFLQA